MHPDHATAGFPALPRAPWRVVRAPLRMHIGLAALALPWLFTSPRAVIALAAAVVVGLHLIKGSDRLWARYGCALGACPRDSHEETWLAGGVCLAYLWSAAEPLNYCIAILVLVFADAAAAFVRLRFGEPRDASHEERWRAAGALAYFVTAFAVAWGALLVASALRPVEALAAAALVATITTGLEASLSEGLHMMFVPIGALVALELALA
jgi:dolichol kinase